ncbi:cytochrome P450 [Streptomyces sp. NBC_01443]|uniref:cytochrome P450 n=1 Tax=Streptomyces sp. NBC_01443 TaxID=2903868 RepID=UPI002253E481|nr:cytochrome P450 [Streptomyces sp. NBC_01443]MCX4633476.1 cytochrome P450 [Streptomyces sp. NBC_01443]
MNAMNPVRPSVIPTAPGRVPGLGHVIPVFRDPLEFLTSLQGLGPIVKIYLGPMPLYVTTSPEAIHRMLVTDAAKFSKGRLFDNAKVVFGDSLLTASTTRHRDQRRLIQPAFHREQVVRLAGRLHQHMVSRIEGWQEGSSLDFVSEMHSLGIEAVVPTLFAAEHSAEVTAKIHHAVPVIAQGLVRRVLFPDFVLALPLRANRTFVAAADELRDAFGDIVGAHHAGHDADGDLISTLNSAVGPGSGVRLSDSQVRDQAVSILLAASETVATTMSWLFHELARHPEIRERFYAEVDEVLGGSPCGYADFPKLVYVEQVLRETLRLHTPNWILTRSATVAVDFDGVLLPEGAEVLYSLSALHRDPALYPDPQVFDPDRWGPDREIPSRTAYIPFGSGAHKCIGDSFAWAEMMIGACTIASRWRLDHTPGTRVGQSRKLATLQPTGLHLRPTAITRHRRESRPA